MFFGKKEEEEQSELSNNSSQNHKQTNTQEQELIKIPSTNLSKLNSMLNIKGDIEGGGSLVVGGNLEGNLSIEDTLFIEDGAKVVGNVKANSIKISGDLKGNVEAKVVEITKNGNLEGNIDSTITLIAGLVNGYIKSANSIEIKDSGVVDTKECKAQKIKVVGKVMGKVIASELLEVISGGSVNGAIVTKGIRTEEGGTIIGNIQTYDETLHEKKEEVSKTQNDNIDPEISKLINIDPNDIQKYAKKESKEVKRV
jgi:cytoskeletal protein CcmA (bactofilin family)